VELLLRLEHAFGVALPDAVIGEAERPRDVAAAVLAATPPRAEKVPEPAPPSGPTRSAPTSLATLPQVLRWHAEANPERTHIFLREASGPETPIGALCHPRKTRSCPSASRARKRVQERHKSGPARWWSRAQSRWPAIVRDPWPRQRGRRGGDHDAHGRRASRQGRCRGAPRSSTGSEHGAARAGERPGGTWSRPCRRVLPHNDGRVSD
jgi:hypothetical protein